MRFQNMLFFMEQVAKKSDNIVWGTYSKVTHKTSSKIVADDI